MVEIPIREHTLNEWNVGLTAAQDEILARFLERRVKLLVRGQTRELLLKPNLISDRSLYCFYLNAALQRPEAQSILPSSSDLSRVKVTRRDASGKTQSWVLDCSNPNNAPDLWLRDGDVIEVPEKN